MASSKKMIRSSERQGKDELTKEDFESGTCRMWNGDIFAGTSIIYAVRDGDFMPVQCDYELHTLMESNPKEVRAYRQSLKRSGLKQPRLRADQLHEELVVIFGPEMSAKKALHTLEFLTRRIKAEGLLTGRDRSDDYVMETVTGKLEV